MYRVSWTLLTNLLIVSTWFLCLKIDQVTSAIAAARKVAPCLKFKDKKENVIPNIKFV